MTRHVHGLKSCKCYATRTAIYKKRWITMEQRTLRNVNKNNQLNTNIYSYVETSGGQSSNIYLKVVCFFNTSVNQTFVAAQADILLQLCLIWAVLLFEYQSYLEISGGQSSNIYLNIVHLWQLKPAVLLHWCLICAFLQVEQTISNPKIEGSNPTIKISKE